MRDAATVLAVLLGAYLALGVPAAVAFLARGVGRIDPVAAASGWGFRLTVFPGVVALWPLLIARWIRGDAAPEERTAHKDAARADTGRT